MPSVFMVTGDQVTFTVPLPAAVVVGGVTGELESAGMPGTAETGHHCEAVFGRIVSVHTESVDSSCENGSH